MEDHTEEARVETEATRMPVSVPRYSCALLRSPLTAHSDP